MLAHESQGSGWLQSRKAQNGDGEPLGPTIFDWQSYGTQ
jgi:hypothetical protein